MHASSASVDADFAAIPVGIIEPQKLFAPFLQQLLTDAGFHVVAILHSMAFEEIERHRLGLVLVDIDYIELEPLEALRKLRLVAPDALICAYTVVRDARWAAKCSRAGANCLLTKAATPSEIVTGINRALQVGVFADRHFEFPIETVAHNDFDSL